MRFNHHSSLVAWLFAGMVLTTFPSSGNAEILYRETFGRPSSPTGNLNPTNWGWAYFGLNGARVTAATGVNGTDIGRPADVENVNAGSNNDGTFGAYTNGFAYSDQSTLSVYLTSEYPINPAEYDAGSVAFSWYQGNAATVSQTRVLIRVGGAWYVSAQVFTNSSAVTLATFQSAAELKALTYNSAASNWLTLNFNGGYDAPTLTTTNSTLGNIALGSAPVSDLSGAISGFGLYFDRNGGSGNTRFDTFTIEASDGAPPPQIVASNQSVSTPMDTPVEIALTASNTNNTPLTFYIAAQPTNGSLGTLNSNLVIYTPNSNYLGFDSFTFYASDGAATSAVATVSISVTDPLVYPSSFQVFKDGTVVLLENFADSPYSSRTLTTYPPAMNFAGQLSRINFLRAEPANAPGFGSRYFVCDLNRNLYIVDKSNPLATNQWTTYINFEEVFPKFDNDPGFAGGLTTFAFDPEYATNGIFYTVHMELTGTVAGPTNGSLPGFNTNGYTTTAAINPPSGSVGRIAVLVEWKDENITNTTFEGTAREIMRVGFLGTIHPMGDLLFHPLAQPGDEDYRNLYIAVGDGRAGEAAGTTHTHPQRLDALVGKILRITPDLNLRPDDELSGNGRYRIPSTGASPNPFVSLTLPNVRKEIYAYGFRNPHRMSWDPVTDKLFVNDIGFHAYEEVNIVRRGENYGYAEREGVEEIFITSSGPNGQTGSQRVPPVPFPNPDLLVVTNGASQATTNVTPTYPVACYSHQDGDAVSSGFVYRGSLMPQLRGKYLFGDITTGRLFYCDLAELLAVDDGNRRTLATIHEIQVVFNSPHDSPDLGVVNRRLFDIVAEEYRAKGGTSTTALPGNADATNGNDQDGVPYGRGRADIRLAVGDDDEIYVISKSDGMIRKMAAVLVPPMIRSVGISNNTVTLSWPSLSNRVYRVQYKDSLAETNWNDLPGDVTATGGTATKTDSLGNTNRFYRLFLP